MTSPLLRLLEIYQVDTNLAVDAVVRQCRYTYGLPEKAALSDPQLESWLAERVLTHHPSLGQPPATVDVRRENLRVIQGFTEGVHDDGD